MSLRIPLRLRYLYFIDYKTNSQPLQSQPAVWDAEPSAEADFDVD